MMKKPISYDKPPYMSNTSRSWERGLLTDQKTYNEDNKIKTWMHYEYEINPVDFSPRKIEGLALYSSKSQSYMANSITSYDVDYGTYSIESKWLYIKQTRERVYHQTDASKYIETVKDFTFNVNNLQVAQITETTSEGKSLITKLRSPLTIRQQVRQSPSRLREFRQKDKSTEFR